MSRLLVAVGLLPVMALAAPGVKDKGPAATYFSTRVGDKLEYELRSGDTVTPAWNTEVVTKVEPAGTGVRITFTSTQAGGRTTESVVSAAPDGLAWLVAYGSKCDTPVPLLKLPPTVGTTWMVGDERNGTKYTVGAVDEEVKVPAGKYKCVRVDAVSNGVTPNVYWYARGVGLVKQTMGGPDIVATLKAFTPTK